MSLVIERKVVFVKKKKKKKKKRTYNEPAKYLKEKIERKGEEIVYNNISIKRKKEQERDFIVAGI
jgi:hypothetical protein